MGFDGIHPSLSHVCMKNTLSRFVFHSFGRTSEKSLRGVRRNKNLLSRHRGSFSTATVEVSHRQRICSFSTSSQVAGIALLFLRNLVSVKISIRIWANVQLDVVLLGRQVLLLTRRYRTIYDCVLFLHRSFVQSNDKNSADFAGFAHWHERAHATHVEKESSCRRLLPVIESTGTCTCTANREQKQNFHCFLVDVLRVTNAYF